MSSRCNVVQVAISLWSPHGDDLPDDIAAHLDECPRCMAAFDARFARWIEPSVAAAPAPAPRRRTASRALPILAVAAMGLLMVPGVSVGPTDSGIAWASPDESPLTAEEQLSIPECPQITDLDHPFCEDSEWL